MYQRLSIPAQRHDTVRNSENFDVFACERKRLQLVAPVIREMRRKRTLKNDDACSTIRESDLGLFLLYNAYIRNFFSWKAEIDNCILITMYCLSDGILILQETLFW